MRERERERERENICGLYDSWSVIVFLEYSVFTHRHHDESTRFATLFPLPSLPPSLSAVEPKRKIKRKIKGRKRIKERGKERKSF